MLQVVTYRKETFQVVTDSEKMLQVGTRSGSSSLDQETLQVVKHREEPLEVVTHSQEIITSS